MRPAAQRPFWYRGSGKRRRVAGKFLPSVCTEAGKGVAAVSVVILAKGRTRPSSSGKRSRLCRPSRAQQCPRLITPASIPIAAEDHYMLLAGRGHGILLFSREKAYAAQWRKVSSF